MIYSGLPKWGIYFFDDETGQRQMLEDELVNRFSPDGKWAPFDKETILQKQ